MIMEIPKNKYAEHAVKFVNNMTHTGDHSGDPFCLRDWQEDIVRLLFGQRGGDKRIIENAFLFLPSGSGKTELCAAIALYCLLTFPPGQEVYSAAVDSGQAGLIFNAARQMVENDVMLSKICEIVPSQKRIVVPDKHSFYCALAADAKRRQGLKPSVVLFDEVHTQKNSDLWNVLQSKMAKRNNPLFIAVTTAGPVAKDHIARQEFEYASKIKGRIENGKWIDSGTIENPSYLSVIYQCKEDQECLCKNNCEEGWYCEKVWELVNPSLGDFKNIEVMRNQFKKVRQIPAQQSSWRSEHLNQWMQASSRWLDLELFDATDKHFDRKELEGKQCIAGALDLAPVHDLSCLSLLFDDEGIYKVITYSWCNEKELEERTLSGVPYDQWRDDGWLKATPGNSTSFPQIRDDIVAISKLYHIPLIATDQHQAYQLAQELMEDYGIQIMWHGQGYRDMSPAMSHLEKLIIDQKIQFEKNPVVKFCFDNTVVITNNYGNIRPDHDKANEKMDATVSVIMAIGAMIANPENQESVYETRGVLTM